MVAHCENTVQSSWQVHECQCSGGGSTPVFCRPCFLHTIFFCVCSSIIPKETLEFSIPTKAPNCVWSCKLQDCQVALILQKFDEWHVLYTHFLGEMALWIACLDNRLDGFLNKWTAFEKQDKLALNICLGMDTVEKCGFLNVAVLYPYNMHRVFLLQAWETSTESTLRKFIFKVEMP